MVITVFYPNQPNQQVSVF